MPSADGLLITAHLRSLCLIPPPRGMPLSVQQEPRSAQSETKGFAMSAENKVDDLAGKAKEGLGKVTGDKSTENEGKIDQAKSSLKDAGEKVKDAITGD